MVRFAMRARGIRALTKYQSAWERDEYRRRRKAALAPLILFTIFIATRVYLFARTKNALEPVIIVGLVILLMAALILYVVSGRIEVDDTYVSLRGIRVPKRVKIADVARLMGVTVAMPGAFGTVNLMRLTLLLDARGHVRLRLSDSQWDPEDLQRLPQVLGVERVERSQEYTQKRLSEEFPGSFSWAARHPMTAAMIGGLFTFFVIIAVIVIVS